MPRTGGFGGRAKKDRKERLAFDDRLVYIDIDRYRSLIDFNSIVVCVYMYIIYLYAYVHTDIICTYFISIHDVYIYT